MIIIILGGIGSGKTLSVVKEIIDKKSLAYTNFKLKDIKNYHRISVSDIIKKDTVTEMNQRKKERLRVNWEFWEDVRKGKKDYSIYLDEIHNIIHSRRAMSKVNILMSKWVSQIRKILSDNPVNHLYIISQTIRKIDIDFRELAQIIVYCRKYVIKGKVYIKQYWYDSIDNFIFGRYKLKKVFLGNNYFKYYDSTALVTFEDAEEFI